MRHARYPEWPSGAFTIVTFSKASFNIATAPTRRPNKGSLHALFAQPSARSSVFSRVACARPASASANARTDSTYSSPSSPLLHRRAPPVIPTISRTYVRGVTRARLNTAFQRYLRAKGRELKWRSRNCGDRAVTTFRGAGTQPRCVTISMAAAVFSFSPLLLRVHRRGDHVGAR